MLGMKIDRTLVVDYRENNACKKLGDVLIETHLFCGDEVAIMKIFIYMSTNE